MLGLSSTLGIAQSSLATNAALSSIVARNISGVNDPNYARRIANLVTGPNGAASVASVSRATDDALFRNLLSSTSDAAASQALSDGLNRLEATVNLSATSSSSTSGDSTSGANSPAALIGALASALDQYAGAPSDTTSGLAVVAAAKALAGSLSSAAATVKQVQAQADKDIASAVSSVNTLLGQFGTVNAAIVKGTATGADVSDALDSRDKILTALSQYLGVNTASTGDGGMAIYTDGGATLFQGSAREVSLAATSGTGGSSVLVDGVPVAGGNAVMPSKSGSIAGLVQLRDTTTVAYGNQLDQIAGGLVSAFAESDQTGGSDPTIPGLFTWSGGTAFSATGATGVAASLSVNANVDPAQGGTVSRLRDGTIGDPGNPAYNANTTGAAGFSTHLRAVLDDLDASRSFDATSGGEAEGSVADYAASSVSWLEAARKSASTTAADRSAVVTQTTASLSSETGVNLDEQLSRMLDLEHSYQASAELMSTVKGMFDSLLSAIQ